MPPDIMGFQGPFLYHSPEPEEPRSINHQFDPKAIYRASLSSITPRSGSSDFMNQNFDSYVFLPKNKINSYPMSKSVKNYVSITRKALFLVRSCQILCSCALFFIGIIANPIRKSTAWIIRIAPAIVTIHTIYALYYLSCKKTGRATAYLAYCKFFAFSDAVTISAFIYISLFFAARPIDNQSIVSEKLPINFILCYSVGFYSAVVSGALYFVSLCMSLYLGFVFRKIAAIPPDMNPLEYNLTSRHKRKKSSISTACTVLAEHNSTPLETKNIFGITYEDLNRQPTIPFSDSRPKTPKLSNEYTSISRDARKDLPSRKLQNPSPHQNPNRLRRGPGYSSSRKNPIRTEDTLRDENDCLCHESDPETQPLKSQIGFYHKKQRGARGFTSKMAQGRYLPLNQQKEPKNEHPNPLQANPLLSSDNFRSSKKFQFISQFSENKKSNQVDQYSTHSMDSDDIKVPSLDLDIEEMDLGSLKISPKYGDLVSGKPPVMVGRNSLRQVSSGHDYIVGELGSLGMLGRREVSGKQSEDDQGHDRPPCLMPRKFSGKLLF